MRPLVNRLTVRLEEVGELVARLQASEWEQALGGYEAIPPPEDLEELADEAAAVSVGASLHARRLVSALGAFQQVVDEIRRIGQRRAREIRGDLTNPPSGKVVTLDFDYLAANQEFHAWRQHRDAVADELYALTRELEPYASDETACQLRALRS